MEQLTTGTIDNRSKELDLELLSHLEDYRPSFSERLQNRLMLLLMEDRNLRTRLLRCVDVLAALPDKGSGPRSADLFREFFRADFPDIPRVLRCSLFLARSPLIPSRILAGLAR